MLALIWQTTFWAIFSQTHLVTLLTTNIFPKDEFTHPGLLVLHLGKKFLPRHEIADPGSLLFWNRAC
jgi:hypothetical protein